MVKALVVTVSLLLLGCAARELPSSTRVSFSKTQLEQPEKRILRLALERRLLTELWLHLSAQKDKLQKELSDPTLTPLEKEVMVEMLVQIEEQQRLTILEIGDD